MPTPTLFLQIDKENIKPVSQLLEREECPPYFYQISVLQKQEKEGLAEEELEKEAAAAERRGDTAEEEAVGAEQERSVSPPEMKDPVSSPYFRFVCVMF